MSEYDHESSITRTPWPPGGLMRLDKKTIVIINEKLNIFLTVRLCISKDSYIQHSMSTN